MVRSLPKFSPRTAGGAIAFLAVVASIGLWAGNSKLSDLEPTLGASVANIARLFDERSPGERTKAELSKSKQASNVATTSAIKDDEVTERVLGKIFPPAKNDHLLVTPEELIALMPLELPSTQLDGEDFTPVAQASFGGPLPVRRGGIGPSFISGGSSGGGGSGVGGSSGGEGGGQPPAPPPHIPAVPEPSTWVLMLMGAAMCGASMRRQKRLQRQTFV